MNILITGATGSVGSGAAELLRENHDIRLSDVVEVDAELPFHLADVREPGALDAASEGADVIVHTPAWHGIHMGQRSEEEFYALNVTGTFNMFRSAVRNRVRRVVWLSSMSVYGDDFYAYTKKLGEQLCRYNHERHGIEVIMLRPADFTPFRDLRHYGERMLHGGVDRRDVLRAVELAVEGPQKFGAYHIVREDRFTEDDARSYADAPADAWERLYPGAKRVIERYGFRLPDAVRPPDLAKEREELGYRPAHHFGTFLAESARDGEIVE
ncbi:Nucleoside-diphosphate-sugar epimerase [Paenibacillus sp. UNC496MF]|uniref:NAD-dependent epimerase/dehydratase family protein n=1 Tax=Paenibacillus sp. UNC496MF TaxID=1502753 RepID=UPI0008EB2503|nr:NAD(P)-dependent oxidoreductase [Paenibacillus sp. UNC496MF]SFI37173.1 Nucleoside-diphosphate-sugar epimerase [Paenibacillus sp. UNC496MF]